MLFFTIIAEDAREDLLERLKKIKDGSKIEREKLLEEYKPFIIKQIHLVTGRFVDVRNSEELSIGLIAFNEAIDSYALHQKGSFLGFARLVIKRRLIDYARKNANRKNEVNLSDFQDENENYLELLGTQEEFDVEKIDRKNEITSYIAELSTYKITLHDLVAHSPKHEDTRKLAFEIAKAIGGRQELKRYLYEKHSLPVKELTALIGVSRKTIERHRKYIIAITILLCGEYDCLQEYLGM